MLFFPFNLQVISLFQSQHIVLPILLLTSHLSGNRKGGFKKFFCYSGLTVMCQFLQSSKVNQFYAYVYPLFLGFPCHSGHRRALTRVPCAIPQVLTGYLFYMQQCKYVTLNLPTHPTSSFCLGVHKLVLYICVSISAWQTSSP